MSNEIQRHERYKQYAIYSYNLSAAKFPKGTKILKTYSNKKTGFFAYTLREGNNIIIVYKGTDNALNRDGKNDVNMAIRKRIPEQVAIAIEEY